MKFESAILTFIIYGLSLATIVGQSDSQNTDLELWSSIQLNLNLGKKWDIKLQEQLRFDDNISSFKQSILQAEAAYDLFKFLELGSGMRLIGVKNDEDLVRYYRWNLDASHKFKLWNVAFDNRLRYQQKKRTTDALEFPNYPTWDIRYRPTISYKRKKWKLEPKLGIEIFWHNEYGELDGFTKNRWFVDFKYKVDKSQSFALRFMQENETKVWDADTDFVLIMKYKYKLKVR